MKKYCFITLIIVTLLYFLNIDKYLQYQFENTLGYIFIYCIVFLIRQDIKPQEFLTKEKIWLGLFVLIFLIDVITFIM